MVREKLQKLIQVLIHEERKGGIHVCIPPFITYNSFTEY